jgi:hypothetical protein
MTSDVTGQVFTVSVRAFDVERAKAASPEYAALILKLPAVV